VVRHHLLPERLDARIRRHPRRQGAQLDLRDIPERGVAGEQDVRVRQAGILGAQWSAQQRHECKRREEDESFHDRGSSVRPS
jgi:hypothetical protein